MDRSNLGSVNEEGTVKESAYSGRKAQMFPRWGIADCRAHRGKFFGEMSALRSVGSSTRGFVGRPPHSFETNRPGIFAVGDVRWGRVKRLAAPVGEGSACVQQVHQSLRD